MGRGLLCRRFLCWARRAAALGQGLPACGIHSQMRTRGACTSLVSASTGHEKQAMSTGVGPGGLSQRHPPGRAWFGVHTLVPHSEESEVQSTRGLPRGLYNRSCIRTCPIPSHTACVPPEPPSILILELPLARSCQQVWPEPETCPVCLQFWTFPTPR